MLHIVNQSPFGSKQIENCLVYLKKEDHLLLVENAVYAALNNTEFSQIFFSLTENIAIYALQPDLIARGLTTNLHDHIQLIDYTGFVKLTIKHHPIISWN